MAWNLGSVSFLLFSRKKLKETSPKVAVVIPKHYGVISRNHDRIHLPLFLLLMDLQSPWRKGLLYSFVLFRVLGPPLCQSLSSVCMVSHSSTALTTIDLWQRHSWIVLRQNFRATSKENAVVESGTFFARNTYI